MLLYKLRKYSDNYSKTSGYLYNSCRDELPLNDTAVTESESFKFKSRLLHNTIAAVTINEEVTVPLKYFTNFWETLEIPYNNCEINCTLTCSANCIISEVDRVTIFAITDTKLYVPVVT